MRAALVIALGSWIGLASSVPEPPAYPEHNWSTWPAAQVSGVIDGDTLSLRFAEAGLNVEMDLAGVRAPGLKQRFGPESAFLSRSLVLGETVRVQWEDGGEPDSLGRRSGIVRREPDGLCLNIELVRAGLAELRVNADGTVAGEGLASVLAGYAARAEAMERGLIGGGAPIAAEPTAVLSSTPEPAEDSAAPGPERVASDEPTDEGGPSLVYVTRSGSRYHRPGCRFISETSKALPIAEANGQYQPCRVCKPKDN